MVFYDFNIVNIFDHFTKMFVVWGRQGLIDWLIYLCLTPLSAISWRPV